MNMFLTSISKFHSSWYLSATFQLNVDCFSAELPILDITCTHLAAYPQFYTSLTAIISALAACVT